MTRIVLLLVALLWLAWSGLGILRAQRARDDAQVEAMAERIVDVERQHNNLALQVEGRLTAIETKLARISESLDWAGRGLFGSVALMALNWLYGMVTAQRGAKRNTNP